jgi:serine/threonine protein kinase
LPICDALHYLHTRTPPIIHRDIKPSNIIVTPAGYPVLVDLGIAKEHAPGTNATATFVRKAGTEGYAPPEQYAAAGQSGPWSDVYAVGATLYHLLTTQIPPTAVERVALDARLVRPSDVNPTVSVATDGAVLRALSVRPQDRFQSIVELARSLNNAASASPPLPVSAPQPIPHAPGAAHSSSTAQWPSQTPRQLAPVSVNTPASVPTPAAQAAVRTRDRRATRKVPALPEAIERDDNARPGVLSRPGVWWAFVVVFALITALAVVSYQHFFAPLDRSTPAATVTGYYNALLAQNYNLAWQYTTSSANDQSSQGAIIANMKADDTRGGPITSFSMSAPQGDASSHVTTTVTVHRARAPGGPAVYIVSLTQYGSIWLIDSVTSS